MTATPETAGNWKTIIRAYLLEPEQRCIFCFATRHPLHGCPALRVYIANEAAAGRLCEATPGVVEDIRGKALEAVREYYPAITSRDQMETEAYNIYTSQVLKSRLQHLENQFSTGTPALPTRAPPDMGAGGGAAAYRGPFRGSGRGRGMGRALTWNRSRGGRGGS